MAFKTKARYAITAQFPDAAWSSKTARPSRRQNSVSTSIIARRWASQVAAKSDRVKYSNVCDVAHVDVTVQSLIATGNWR